MEARRSHNWPGNVRELQNFLERAVIMSPGSELTGCTGELIVEPGSYPRAGNRTLKDLERERILEVLGEVGEW